MSNLQDGDVNTASASTLPAIERIFGIDLRSLAFFRMALGVTVIADLLLRWRFLGAHYADLGVLPRAAGIPGIPGLSMHGFSGSIAFEGLLFTLAVGFAFLFLIGLHTRVATVASWLLMTSLHLRNPILLDGGDAMARWLLLWSIFLPLGACWSVDSRNPGRRFPPSNGGRVLSLATVAILLQLVLLYWGGGLCKTGPEWTSDGTALVQYPWLLRLLSRATFVLEIAGPLLLFVPGRANASLRTVVVGVFVLFHLGLLLCMQLGIFPLVCMAAWLLYLPTRTWDSLRFPRVTTTRIAPCQRDHSRPRNTLAAVVLVYITVSALLTWVAPTATLSTAYQQAGKQVCLYQQWFMFNTPSKGKRQ